MGTTVIRNNPAAMAMLQQNCMEHILLMAQEQVDLEFMEEKTENAAVATTNTANDATSTRKSYAAAAITTKPTDTTSISSRN